MLTLCQYSTQIMQIPAFLKSRDWLLKGFSLESVDFQMSPSTKVFDLILGFSWHPLIALAL
jgi:hypothetical protein